MGKRYNQALKQLGRDVAGKATKKSKSAKGVGAEVAVTLTDAIEKMLGLPKAKFDESVEIAINLGVNPKKAEENVRGTVTLPHGTGKTVRVAVFCKGEKIKEALAAGADFAGAEDLVEKIQGGWMDFDAAIATPDMMILVGKIGKLLGPRGLMPNPKIGTVTFDVAKAVDAVKGGRVEFRVEKAGIVQVGGGKVSFGKEKLTGNLSSILDAILKAKPQSVKGTYLKSAYISSTMGPSIEVDLAPFRQ